MHCQKKFHSVTGLLDAGMDVSRCYYAKFIGMTFFGRFPVYEQLHISQNLPNTKAAKKWQNIFQQKKIGRVLKWKWGHTQE